MDIKFNHTGLHVLQVDVKSFYEDILGFEEERSFALSAEESLNIFGIDSRVNIVQGNCGNVNLELFISSNLIQPSYNHVCIAVSDAKRLSELALHKGYKVHTRNGKVSTTYFISDSNNNIFEVKNL